MKKEKRFNGLAILLLLFLLCLPAIRSLLVPGYFGASDDMHIAWLAQMHETLLAGKFPPRIAADLSYGFGYPLFNFVFPLPFYIGELIHTLGFNFVDSTKAVLLLGIVLSAGAMYLFLKEVTTKILAFAGSILYVYTPYRATEVYIRGAIGEAFSFVFLPLITLAIVKLTEGKKQLQWKWVCVGGLSAAGLILTHNIVSYMFIPLAFLLAVIRVLFVSKQKNSLLGIIAVFCLGLAGSIYFWLPALLDSRLMRYDTLFSYYDHFPSIKQLITPYFGYGASVPGPYDGLSFFIGGVNLALFAMAVFSLTFLRKKVTKEKLSLIVWLLLVFLIAVFMQNHRSAFLWQRLPLLPYFQFPWRFLTMTTFASSVFIIVFSVLPLKNLLAVLIIISSVFSTAAYFRPQDFLQRSDEYYLNRYVPYPIPSPQYREVTEEYLRLPILTKERPNERLPRFTVHEGSIANLNELNRLDAKAIILADKEQVLHYNKYYFPGWKVWVDGKPVPVMAADPYGQIAFGVPEGEHNVIVSFGETVRNKVLNWVSFVTIFAMIVFSFAKRFKKQ